MNTAKSVCAPTCPDWQGINWSRVKRQVQRLQARIVKATQDGRYGKVKALQWLLTHSFSGKALAVKRVTENRGKPGLMQTARKPSRAGKQINGFHKFLPNITSSPPPAMPT